MASLYFFNIGSNFANSSSYRALTVGLLRFLGFSGPVGRAGAVATSTEKRPDASSHFFTYGVVSCHAWSFWPSTMTTLIFSALPSSALAATAAKPNRAMVNAPKLVCVFMLPSRCGMRPWQRDGSRLLNYGRPAGRCKEAGDEGRLWPQAV